NTYSTVTFAPTVATAPVPVSRLALSSCVGGAPGGTMRVGAVPALPAGERSWVGIGAIVEAPVLAGGCVPAVVAVVAFVEGVVEAPEEELPQAARPTAKAVISTSGQTRTRDMKVDSSEGSTRAGG